MKPVLSLVMPAYNEQEQLRDTVEIVTAAMRHRGGPYEILIVDDGSTDSTGSIADDIAAADSNVRVIHNGTNRGLGYSYWHGVRRASGDYITWLPADNPVPLQALDPLFDQIARADIVISYPVLSVPRPWLRRVLSRTYTMALNTAFGFNLTYFNCVTIFRAEQLKTLQPRSSGFSIFAEVLVRLLDQGHGYVEVPLIARERSAGESKALRFSNIRRVVSSMAMLFWDLRIRRVTRT